MTKKELRKIVLEVIHSVDYDRWLDYTDPHEKDRVAEYQKDLDDIVTSVSYRLKHGPDK